MKSTKPIFLKSVGGFLFAIALGYSLLLRADKNKSSFQKVTGIIASFEKTNKYFPNKDSLKFRYLEIIDFPKTFELFIGKGSGDFKPKFERVDNLKLNDTITIFFDENSKTQSDPINRLTYYIDRGKEVIFIKGSSEKYMAYFVIDFSLICILILIILKRKSKII